MGGAVSAGRNNEELVDNLCYEGYIHEPCVEKVFRKVDRRDYMIFDDDDDPLEAYEDHAWRKGTLHLSAPCIYTRAVEALKLKKGVSFLNIGSGTGYLSTMAGMLIGPYGINHGIELHTGNVEYAYKKVLEFCEHSAWYDPMEFCDPVFIVGNGLLLSPGNMLYDRIYCGAGCPPEHSQLMKNMINIGGLLVMPQDNQLECICRTGETEWETDVVLPSVSFASLMLPTKEALKEINALEIPVEPHSLKELCRLEILKQLGRDSYGRISELPLPGHLQDYVSHYREWGPPPPCVKTLCPIDQAKKAERDAKRQENNDRHENSASGRDPARNGPSIVRTVEVFGRRMLLCNFNGITFQVPVDDDSSDGDGDSMDHNHDRDDDSPDPVDLEQFEEASNQSESDNGLGASFNESEMSQSLEIDTMDTEADKINNVDADSSTCDNNNKDIT